MSDDHDEDAALIAAVLAMPTTSRVALLRFLTGRDETAEDRCNVCGKVIGHGIRALHLNRCDEHRDDPD
jgi:hypothetical protein